VRKQENILIRDQVLNASPYFGKIWNVLKRWIDPRTAEKLVIVPPDKVMPTLSESISIANIPQAYGGQFAFEPGMPPELDKDTRAVMTWLSEPTNVLPKGPIKWIVDEQGIRKALAVGKQNGTQRHQLFARLNS